MGVGLLFTEILHSWEIMNTFWLGIAILGLGIAGLILFKPWMSQRSWIFWLLTVIIGIGIGLGLAECLPVLSKLPEMLRKSSLIIKMGILLVWIGIIIYMFVKFKGKGKDRIIGIVALVVTIVGVFVAADKGLLNAVQNIGNNLPKLAAEIDTLATHTSGIDGVLKNGIDSLEKRTSSINITLKNGIDSLEKRTSSINTTLKNGIDSLEKQTLSIDSLVKKTSDIDSKLQNLKIPPLINNIDLQDLRARLTMAEESLKVQIQQLDQISAELISQTEVTQEIEEKLESHKNTIRKMKQAQNSVRLLIGSEDILTNKGILDTDRSICSLGRKTYRLSKKFSADTSLVIADTSLVVADTSLVAIIPIGTLFPLSDPQKLKLVGGSGPLVLKALVYHSGKLKERQYKWETGRDTTIIFTDPFLGGMDILAVVKRNNEN